MQHNVLVIFSLHLISDVKHLFMNLCKKCIFSSFDIFYLGYLAYCSHNECVWRELCRLSGRSENGLRGSRARTLAGLAWSQPWGWGGVQQADQDLFKLPAGAKGGKNIDYLITLPRCRAKEEGEGCGLKTVNSQM